MEEAEAESLLRDMINQFWKENPMPVSINVPLVNKALKWAYLEGYADAMKEAQE